MRAIEQLNIQQVNEEREARRQAFIQIRAEALARERDPAENQEQRMGDNAEREAREHALLASTALKEQSISSQQVDKLQDIDFFKFERQLKRQAHNFDWPKWILDRDQVEPDDGDLTMHAALCKKNAYMLITSKCDGHEDVDTLLQAVEIGDARTAWLTVQSHFLKQTQAGLSRAYQAFYGATMASTNNNIIQWTSNVPLLAKVLIQAGGQANESAQLTQLIAGLLPDFQQVQTLLELRDGLTYEYAKAKLLDFAHSKNLGAVTASSSKGARHNTYTVSDKRGGRGGRKSGEKRQCPGWVRHQCRWPDCKFDHSGPGGHHPAVAANGNKYVSLRDTIEWELKNPHLLPGGAVNVVQAPAVDVAQAPRVQAPAAAVNMAQAPAVSDGPVAQAHVKPPHQQPSRVPRPGAATCYVCNGCDHDVTTCPVSMRARLVRDLEPDHGVYSIDDEVDEADFDVQEPPLHLRAFGAMRVSFVFLAVALPLLLGGFAVDAGTHIAQNSLPLAGALGLLLCLTYGATATSVPARGAAHLWSSRVQCQRCCRCVRV